MELRLTTAFPHGVPRPAKRGYWMGMRKGGALQEEVATAQIKYVKPVFLTRERLEWLTQGTTKEYRRNLQKGREYPMVSRNRPLEDLRVNDKS